MKKSKYKWKSVFYRMGLIFLAAIMPVTLIVYFIFSRQIQAVDQATIEKVSTNVSKNYHGIEKNLENIDSLCMDILYNEDVMNLALANFVYSDYENTRLIKNIYTLLATIKSSNRYIEKISLYIPSYNKWINSEEDTGYFSGSIKDTGISSHSGKKSMYSLEDKKMSSGYLPTGSQADNDKFQYLITVDYNIKMIEADITEGLPEHSEFVFRNKDDIVIAAKAADKKLLKWLPLRDNDQGWMTINKEKYWVINRKTNSDDLKLSVFLPEKSINQQMKNLRTWLVVFSGLLIVFILVVVTAFAKYMRKPLLGLVKAHKKVEDGEYNFRLPEENKDEFGYLNSSFNHMTAQIQHLVEQVYKSKILYQESELKQLQSWINPHFLYNCFFTISNMARLEDDESIKTFTEYLGKYYRFVTKTELQTAVTLKEEVEHSRTYADIQKMRFGESLNVQFDQLPEEVKEWKVPRLFLQPFIENAFEHGLREVEEQKLLVAYKLDNDKEGITIYVEDNGTIDSNTVMQMNKSLEGEGITGTVNVYKRLKLFYGDKANVCFFINEWKGLGVEITILKQEMNENENTNS